MENVILYRRDNLPSWEFKFSYEHSGLVYKTSNNVYKLFFENPFESFKPIWIGRLHDNVWITWEKEIKAKSIEFCGTKVIFT